MRVTFDFFKRNISIEGDAPELVQVLTLAKDIAPKLPEITILTSGDVKDPHKPDAAKPASNHDRQLPMREWARRLNLANHVERVTALGYFATKIEGKESFSPKEMSTWYNHCGFQKPTQMAVAVFDAKKKYGYLESVGHGQCRLTTSGENLIIGKLEEPMKS